MDFVVYGNGRYVAFGEYSDYGVILTSEDGITWVVRSDGGATSGSGISFSVGLVYTGGKFFALGGFGQSGVSTNGVDWSVVSGYWGLNSSAGIAYGASKYVGVGWDQFGSDQNIFTSTDGLNWTPRHSGSGSYLVDVAYGAGLFVALGAGSESGHNYTSPTGPLGQSETFPLEARTLLFTTEFSSSPTRAAQTSSHQMGSLGLSFPPASTTSWKRSSMPKVCTWRERVPSWPLPLTEQTGSNIPNPCPELDSPRMVPAW